MKKENKIKIKYVQNEPSEESEAKLSKAFEILFEEVSKSRKIKNKVKD